VALAWSAAMHSSSMNAASTSIPARYPTRWSNVASCANGYPARLARRDSFGTTERTKRRRRLISTVRLSCVVYLMPFAPYEWLLRTSLAAWFLFLTPNAL
jgi:hypothetical protein